ncbi:MAG: hypothetical protein WCS90_03835 [Bacilli bacterium]
MKQKIGLAVGILSVLPLSSCVGYNYSPSSADSFSFSSTLPLDSTYLSVGSGKGIEAYCWREDGEWRCGLLPGTNRNKSTAEVDALKGISLEEMKRVLRTFDPRTYVMPFRVSRPCKESELNHEEETTAIGANIQAYLNDHLGLADYQISTSSVSPSYCLSLEAKARFYLTKDVAGFYPADSWIEVNTGTLTDVDLDLYLDGVLTSRSYQFAGENQWSYFFKMPAHATTLSFMTYSVAYSTFGEAYPWAKELTESQIDRIDAVSENYDVGPGGMKSLYHGETSQDKQTFLAFSQDNLLREDRYAGQVSGGIPVTFAITIGGVSHSFVLNGTALDGKYVSSKTLANPSSFDYSAFIAYNQIRLWDKEEKYARIIADGSFLEDVHFHPYTPNDVPALTGYHFALRPGVYFIDAKHFKYGETYFEIISTADFAAYING